MKMQTYIRGILDLEIVDQLYILRESENDSKTYLVSATGLNDSSGFMMNSKVLDKEFVYSFPDFHNILKSLKKNFKVTTYIYEGEYVNCPYQSKVWIVSKK